MKKIIILTLFCCGLTLSVAAQESTDGQVNPSANPKGTVSLPQAGDFALGIDATPLLKYVGNMFNNSSDIPAPFTKGTVIYGKYFLENDQAVRAKLGMEFTKNKYKQTLADDERRLTDPTNLASTTVDVENVNTSNLFLNIGYELRKGKGRVQGFYGAEFLLTYKKESRAYDYGNPVTVANQMPSTTNFGSNLSVAQGYRQLSNNGGATFGLGIGGFVGVEYFLTSQISIGTEFNLGFNYSVRGQDEIKTEGCLGNGVQEFQYRNRDKKDSAFETGIKMNSQGAIFLMFHF